MPQESKYLIVVHLDVQTPNCFESIGVFLDKALYFQTLVVLSDLFQVGFVVFFGKVLCLKLSVFSFVTNLVILWSSLSAAGPVIRLAEEPDWLSLAKLLWQNLLKVKPKQGENYKVKEKG